MSNPTPPNSLPNTQTGMSQYRARPSEKARISDLLALLPVDANSVLDIGARDGFISKLLIDRFASVTALDLEMPVIDDARIQCVEGNITALGIPDNSFDIVFCAEVLEHIPCHLLQTACNELGRVARRYLLVGVPYKQDLRVGRCTCQSCGKFNPPYGHVNSFDERFLSGLFPGFSVAKTSFVGETDARTNFVSSALMNMAGNPYGTYSQDEPCIHCGSSMKHPPERRVWQRVCTKLAHWGNKMQPARNAKRGNWIHMLLEKHDGEVAPIV